ncbi:MAG: hypothetical protein JW953_19375 [Anaerolineae bacterium]|nr:hypothetical protein [Anaerolineae bacterium]
MKNQATLSKHLTGPAQVEIERYQSILAEVEGWLSNLSAPLQAIARPSFESLAEGEFSQVAALLPYWLSDLLPVPAELCHRLGLAQLYFWWYYFVQDELLDRQADPAGLVIAHLALLRTVDIFDGLGLTRVPCWAEFDRLTRTCAEATALELQVRFATLDEITPDRVAAYTLDFVGDRLVSFYFTTIAQLHLAGILPEEALHHDIPAALRCFAAARQLGDDASDWLADLQAGQLNYVSARLISHLYQTGRAGDGLDVERLAGYQITAEEFWAGIEQTAQGLNQQALDCLAPYGHCRLAALIRRQMARHAEQWVAGREYRAKMRQMFGAESPGG